MAGLPQIPAQAAKRSVDRCSACQEPTARHRLPDGRSLSCEQALRRAKDRCGYCGHVRADHDRAEPGNPHPGLRCDRGCICAAFIESDGWPDWSAPKPAPQPAAEAGAPSPKREPLDISGWTLIGVAASDTDPSATYELRREPDGEQRIGCTCKGWQHRWSCKHVTRFLAAQGQL